MMADVNIIKLMQTKHPTDVEVLFLYPKSKEGEITMGKTVNALKSLGKKCNTSQTEPTGKTISKVIESIEDNFNINGAKGDTGAAGASVTAITLYTTEGAVTGGVATLSNGSTVNITVTTTPSE